MESYLEFVLERLSIAGNVTIRAMFGGHGIYSGDLMFGLVADGVLYLKVGESNIKDYIQANMKPFSYEAKNGKPISMSYWRLPLDILESNDDLPKWINKAVEAAKMAKPKKSYLAKYKSISAKKKAVTNNKKLPVKLKKPASKKKTILSKKSKTVISKKKKKK
ncbi:MAG: TfoX/Sxy family protein [Leptospiraceae bacterium]|nr:TfoX/Sxy family protein [Leptospiraceae bacterium]